MEIKALIDLLEDPDPYVRADAVIKLGTQGVMGTASLVRKLCEDNNQMVAIAALHASWQLGEDNLSIDRLFDALRSKDEELRQQAVQIVSARGERLIPQIVPILGRSADDTELAITVLEEIGGQAALDVLVRLPKDYPQLAPLVEDVLQDWEY